MNILLTNDDGIYARGLNALLVFLSQGHQVNVVAPASEQSAVGHGITLYTPLRAERIKLLSNCWGYAVTGSPVDCVKIALTELLNNSPDIIISGINNGLNTGINVNYSGTVAAVREAALYGIPGIAVSMAHSDLMDYDGAARFVEKLMYNVIKNGLPFGTFLNVNIPGIPINEIRGVQWTNQSISRLSDGYEKRIDPKKNAYYWPIYDPLIFKDQENTDGYAISNHHISITPLQCDVTDYNSLKTMKKWDMSL